MKKLWVVDLTFFSYSYDNGQEMVAREVATTRPALLRSMESLKGVHRPKDLEDWSILVEEYVQHKTTGVHDFRRSWTWRPGMSDEHYAELPPWSTDGLLAMGTWGDCPTMHLL